MLSSSIFSPSVRTKRSEMLKNQFIDVEHSRIERLAPRKCQQSLSQLGGPLRTNERIVECPFRPCLDYSALGNAEIADDDGEEIVEIVRDTASQLTDSFHFLRLPQGLLGQLAALGLGVKGLRPPDCQQDQSEEKQCSGNSENQVACHQPNPAGINFVGLQAIGHIQV